MNSMPKVLLVCLLALLDACVANHTGRSRRQDSTPQPCRPCVLPPVNQLQPAIDLLKVIGQNLQILKEEFNKLFNTSFQNKDELRSAIDQIFKHLEAKTNNLFEKLFSTVDEIESCPPLANLFYNVKINFDKFMEALAQNWEESISNADLDSAFDDMALAMASDVPTYLTFVRDLLVSCVDVFLTNDCHNLVPMIYTVLDPNGNLSIALAKKLSSSNSDAIKLGESMIGSLLPNRGGEPLDYLRIIATLMCAGLHMIQPDTDLREETGGFCAVSIEQPDYISAVKSVLCGVAFVVHSKVLTQDFKKFCKS